MQSFQGARPRLEQSGMKRSLKHNRGFDFVTVDRFKQERVVIAKHEAILIRPLVAIVVRLLRRLKKPSRNYGR